MKKLFALIAAAVLALSLLTACGSPSPSAADAGSSPSAPVEPSDADVSPSDS